MKRLRGAVSIGLLWGIAWGTGGVALATWRVLFGRPHFANPSQYLGRFMWTGGTVLGVCGLVAGAAFALALSRAERDREVATLSPRRAAVWGAVGGAIAGAITIPLLGILAIPAVAIGAAAICAVGSISAFATVRLALRGAPTIDRLNSGIVPNDRSAFARRST